MQIQTPTGSMSDEDESFHTAECRSFSSGGKGALDGDDEVQSNACTRQPPSLTGKSPISKDHIDHFQRSEKRPASPHDIRDSAYQKIAPTSTSTREGTPTSPSTRDPALHGEIAPTSPLIAASPNDDFIVQIPAQRHATKTPLVPVVQSHLSILQGPKNVAPHTLRPDEEPICSERLKGAGPHQQQQGQLQEIHGSLKVPLANTHQQNINKANTVSVPTIRASSGDKQTSQSSLDLNKPPPIYNTMQQMPTPPFRHQLPYGAQQPIAARLNNASTVPGQPRFYRPQAHLNILHQMPFPNQNMPHRVLSSNQNVPYPRSSGELITHPAGKMHGIGGRNPMKWDPYTCTWISETKPGSHTQPPPLLRSPTLASRPMPAGQLQGQANVYPQNATRVSPVTHLQRDMYAASEWAVHQSPNNMFHGVPRIPARQLEEVAKNASVVNESWENTPLKKSASTMREVQNSQTVTQSQKDTHKDVAQGISPVGQSEGCGTGGTSAKIREGDFSNDAVDKDGEKEEEKEEEEEEEEDSVEDDDEGEVEEDDEDDDDDNDDDEDDVDEDDDEGDISEEDNYDEH